MIDNSNLPPGVSASDPHISGDDDISTLENEFYTAALLLAEHLEWDALVALAKAIPEIIPANDAGCDTCAIRYDDEIFRAADYSWVHQYEDRERTEIALSYCPVCQKEQANMVPEVGDFL